LNQEEENLVKAVKRNAEKISESDVFLSLVTSKYVEDPYCAMQLGLAILMEKPIYLLVKDGTHIPNHLFKIADKIEHFNDDTLKSATDKLFKNLKSEESLKENN